MEIPKKSPAKSAVAPLAPFVRPRAVKRARTFLPEFHRRIFVRSDVHPWSAWSKTSNCRRAVPELLSAARPEWFSKGFREPRMSLPSTGSFNSTIQFSPSANLCFWDGIYSALPVRNPAWSQSFRFSCCHCDGKSKLACAGGHTELFHFHGTWLRVRRGVTLAILPMDTSRWSWKDSRICPCNRSSIFIWILGAMSFSCWFYFFLQKSIG